MDDFKLRASLDVAGRLREEAASQTRLRVAPACSRYVAYGVDVGGLRWTSVESRTSTLDFGIALLFSSLCGAVLMAISAPLFLIRIRVEEEMLINEFGDAYLEYREHTRKIIPYIY